MECTCILMTSLNQMLHIWCVGDNIRKSCLTSSSTEYIKRTDYVSSEIEN